MEKWCNLTETNELAIGWLNPNDILVWLGKESNSEENITKDQQENEKAEKNREKQRWQKLATAYMVTKPSSSYQ